MQKFTLSIPTPCHENWQEMTPTEKGRFCAACAKEVIDFSSMTDKEVLQHFNTISSSAEVCGRAFPDQLNRNIAPAMPAKKVYWYWQYAAMFLLLLNKPSASKAQYKLPNKTEHSKPTLRGLMVNTNPAIQNTVSGKIVDDKGSTIPFATVVIVGTKVAASANEDGDFSIAYAGKIPLIKVSAIGYTDSVFSTNKLANNIYTLKQIRTESVLIGETVVSFKDEDPDTQNHVANIVIVANENFKPIAHASLVLKQNNEPSNDTVFTNKNGEHKIKNIKPSDFYSVSVEAPGFLPQTFIISGSNFENRKITKKIFLEKAPVVDDFKILETVKVNTTDVALKSKLIMDCSKQLSGAMISGLTVTSSFTDTLKLLATKINGSLQIFPSPAQKGSMLNIAIKEKINGNYLLRVVDASGRVVLQEPIIISSKNQSIQLPTNSNWGSGVYYICLFNNQQKLISKNSFVLL